jgi:prevent-host-death family protein
MPTIGVRELKSHASEIVRMIREERAEYVVTLRGEPVAVLLPIDKQALEAHALRAFEGDSPPTAAQPNRAELLKRALDLAGRFHAGVADLSEEHDRYLVEAFES